MSMEYPGGSKFTQAVAYHSFGDVEFFKGFTIMDKEGMTDKFWGYLALTRPSFDRLLSSSYFLVLNFPEELFINIRSLFA